MKQLVLRRALAAVVTLLFVMTFLFALLALMPGDPAVVAAGDNPTPEVVERMRELLGLNESMPNRYLSFMTGALTGDLGESVRVRPGVAVTEVIWDSVPVTFSLVVVSLVIALVIALPAGSLAGLWPHSAVDVIVTGAAAFFLAVPVFVVALFLTVYLAVNWGWLPAIGYVPISDGLWEWLRHLLLPCIALGLSAAAEIARQVRGAVIDSMDQDYARTADAKGMSRAVTLRKHVGKNAAPPVLVVTGLQVTRLIGGTIVIEALFGLGGLGSLMYDAVLRRDIPLIQGLVFVVAIVVIALNVVIDVLIAWLNPRERAA